MGSYVPKFRAMKLTLIPAGCDIRIDISRGIWICSKTQPKKLLVSFLHLGISRNFRPNRNIAPVHSFGIFWTFWKIIWTWNTWITNPFSACICDGFQVESSQTLYFQALEAELQEFFKVKLEGFGMGPGQNSRIFLVWISVLGLCWFMLCSLICRSPCPKLFMLRIRGGCNWIESKDDPFAFSHPQLGFLSSISLFKTARPPSDSLYFAAGLKPIVLLPRLKLPSMARRFRGMAALLGCGLLGLDELGWI